VTAQTPPTFLQASSHPAEDVRRMMHAMLGGRSGIVAAGDMAVTQNGTPNMSVNVAGGQLVLAGTEGTYQGVYVCENRGTQNVAIAAADSTNARRDLIVARVRDAAYSGATNSFAIEVVTGTPAASPVDPAIPANSYVLARIAVAAGATSITNANITDGRSSWSGQYGRAAALGGTIICTSTTRPTGVEGMRIYETDTKQELVHNGTTFVPIVPLGQWTAWTPTLVQSVSVAFTTTYARYMKIGRMVKAQCYLVVTGSGTATQTVVVGGLPFTAAQASLPVGEFWISDASVPTNFIGGAVLLTTTSVAGLFNNNAGYFGTHGGFTAGLASGDAVLINVEYEATS
jgi:hypothetical protein